MWRSLVFPENETCLNGKKLAYGRKKLNENISPFEIFLASYTLNAYYLSSVVKNFCDYIQPFT